MNRPLSQLVYARFREVPGTRRAITLHRHGEFLHQMKETGLAANPDGTVIGLQASKGVYLGRTIVGYMWFVGPLEQPSPVHFGDGMQEIERFLWDEIDRQSSESADLPFLIGEEQGGIMALAMAGAVPDLLSGVVAIDANFPVVAGWEPPLAPLNGLPVLLVNPRPRQDGSARVLAGDALVAELERWGATVTVVDSLMGPLITDRIASWLAQQSVRTYRGNPT